MEKLAKLVEVSGQDGEFSFSQKDGKASISVKCNQLVAMQGICEIIDACAKNITSNSELSAFLYAIKEECEELMPKGKCDCDGK